MYDERLLAYDAVILYFLISRKLEERIILVPDITGILVIIPESVIGKINLLDIYMTLPSVSFQDLIIS